MPTRVKVKFSRRRRYRRRGRSSLAKKVAKLSRMTKPETKYLQTVVTPQQVTWAGQFYDLHAISQGPGVHQRVGDKVFFKKMHIRLGYSVGAVPSFLRVLVVVDKLNLISNVNQVLAITNNAEAPLSHYNMDFKPRYSVKFDRTFTLSAEAHPGGTVNRVLTFNKAIRFETGSTTERTNNIRLVVISNINPGAAVGDRPLVYWSNQFYWTDV